MGHIRLGRLPATQWWEDVVGLVTEGAAAPRVAEATTHAWHLAFDKVRNDAGFREAVWLLTQLADSGKPSKASAKPTGGLDVSAAGSVIEVALALSEAMDRRLEADRKRSDFGELAQRALVASVTEHLQKEMPPLLEPSKEDVARAVRMCGKEKDFGLLSKSFFARLTNECLNYFLSKALPGLVGEKRRFTTTEQLVQFENAMRKHCEESAVIVEDFSGKWLSKNMYKSEGQISRETAEKFGWYGLEKVREELAVRARKDAAK